jgi:hypothetical protein
VSRSLRPLLRSRRNPHLDFLSQLSKILKKSTYHRAERPNSLLQPSCRSTVIRATYSPNSCLASLQVRIEAGSPARASPASQSPQSMARQLLSLSKLFSCTTRLLPIPFLRSDFKQSRARLRAVGPLHVDRRRAVAYDILKIWQRPWALSQAQFK